MSNTERVVIAFLQPHSIGALYTIRTSDATFTAAGSLPEGKRMETVP